MRFGKVIFLLVNILVFASVALAAENAKAPIFSDWAAFSGGIGMGIAVLGAGLGQGKAVAAALEAIGRNPGASGSLFVPMILGLVFIETLVLFAFLIMNGLTGIQ